MVKATFDFKAVLSLQPGNTKQRSQLLDCKLHILIENLMVGVRSVGPEIMQ